MPPTTSSTIATLISAIHTPRGAREVSSCSRSMNAWMRESMRGLFALLITRAPFDQRFDDQGDHREQRQERGDGEGAHEIVLLIEDLDVQRHGRGHAAHMPADDRDCAEFA